MTPPLSHLLETSLYVAALDRSQDFYRRVFDLPLLLQDDRMVALGLPGPAVLLLFRRGGSTAPSPVPGGLIPAHDGHGTQHLCFAIPVASLPDWDRHLTSHGIVIESRVIQAHGGTSLYVRDPDGHSIEVATPGLWSIY